MKKRVRIKDIASRANVSTGTVDRVLHNRGKVADDVRKRVLQVIDELGYERNLIASALAYNKQIRVASLLPLTHVDPYWRQTNQGLVAANKSLQHYGMMLEPFFFDYGDPRSFLETARKAIEIQPDGILVPPMFDAEAHWLVDACEASAIPYVFINTHLEDANPVSYIGQDSYQSGVLGARLLNFGLAEGGHVCILNLDYSTRAAQHLISKEKGFKDYFAERPAKKINIIREDFEDFDDPHRLQKFLADLLHSHPLLSGIFVTNSRAYKILDIFEKPIVERNIKIVGFDLIPQNLQYLHDDKINFLINQNPAEQGFIGLHSLFKHLVSKEPVEKIQYLPLDIVVKENAAYYVKKMETTSMVMG
ncbi:MAG: LacI family DNA-binding transcriptional regulator [Saprospiraceae bacterium]